MPAHIMPDHTNTQSVIINDKISSWLAYIISENKVHELMDDVICTCSYEDSMSLLQYQSICAAGGRAFPHGDM